MAESALIGPFVGAKLALTCGADLLVYLRDDNPALPWPSHWDLPGGGREGDESPQSCALRELEEEFGLRLSPARLTWGQEFPSMLAPEKRAWFFAGHITHAEIASIRFGDEGQRWCMMPIETYLTHPKAIPDLQRRVTLACL